jgi:hypothetical protein
VDRTDMKKVPLFPEGTWRAKYGSMSGVFNEVHHVYFYGKYPGGKLFASVDAPYDRGGYGGVNDLVLGATGWETSSEGHPRSLGCQLVSWVAPGRDESGCSEPRRGLLPELAKAPFRVERIVTLPDGSGVAVLRDALLAIRSRKTGAVTEQPGDVMPLGRQRLRHLNATLYRIMPDDSEGRRRKDGDKLKARGVDYVRLHALGLEPWVSFNDAGKQWLAMTPAGSLTAFLPAPAQRKPREPHDIPQPTKLEDSRTTPFAILSSNQSPHWVFETTLSHFYADPTLQGDATFMSIQRGNGTFFGVQLKSREALKKVEAIASANRIKPKLACLDALAKIPVDQPTRGRRSLLREHGPGAAARAVKGRAPRALAIAAGVLAVSPSRRPRTIAASSRGQGRRRSSARRTRAGRRLPSGMRAVSPVTPAKRLRGRVRATRTRLRTLRFRTRSNASPKTRSCSASVVTRQRRTMGPVEPRRSASRASPATRRFGPVLASARHRARRHTARSRASSSGRSTAAALPRVRVPAARPLRRLDATHHQRAWRREQRGHMRVVSHAERR